ncbi:MAG: hypothetical protein A2Y76_03915 [Planctomycetes bacterium RBG_13_60_9]|nr:MAG: hypothetical protein A2Y76_03915 [Planctomycetes bacterium RBG_13_60_9]
MRKSLLMVALTLVTVWATGCVLIDAGGVESREPAKAGSDQIVIRESHAAGSAFEPSATKTFDPARE